MMKNKYRLVTRSDFDGLVCAVLLKKQNLIDDIIFVQPKDMQDGRIEITERDITTNLPYVPGAYLVFDHHASEVLRNSPERPPNYILDPRAPSAARIVYEYFGGMRAFLDVNQEMLAAVDKADSGNFSHEEILYPRDWVLLNFIMDPRTGLGRFKHFRISNYNLMMQLIDACHDHDIVDILAMPDVRERVDLYFFHQKESIKQLRRCSRIEGNVVVIDLREEEEIYVNNRFMIYSLYPECHTSIHMLWGLQKQNTVLAVGASILNRRLQAHIGALTLKYGGGGHAKAGTCQVENERAEAVLKDLVKALN